MKRRQYFEAMALGATGVLAGCTDGGGSGGSGGQNQRETECRMVERTREKNLADKLDTVSAGSGWTWKFDLEEGDRLIISARLVNDGARPALVVENPSGATVAEVGPSERIQRQITAREDGRYFVRMENEATLTSGQWDMVIDWKSDYEERVCD